MANTKNRLRQACMDAAPYSPGFAPDEADAIVRGILTELQEIAGEHPATTEHGTPSLDFLAEVAEELQ